jgi:hypothetical protein
MATPPEATTSLSGATSMVRFGDGMGLTRVGSIFVWKGMTLEGRATLGPAPWLLPRFFATGIGGGDWDGGGFEGTMTSLLERSTDSSMRFMSGAKGAVGSGECRGPTFVCIIMAVSSTDSAAGLEGGREGPEAEDAVERRGEEEEEAGGLVAGGRAAGVELGCGGGIMLLLEEARRRRPAPKKSSTSGAGAGEGEGEGEGAAAGGSEAAEARRPRLPRIMACIRTTVRRTPTDLWYSLTSPSSSTCSTTGVTREGGRNGHLHSSRTNRRVRGTSWPATILAGITKMSTLSPVRFETASSTFIRKDSFCDLFMGAGGDSSEGVKSERRGGVEVEEVEEVEEGGGIRHIEMIMLWRKLKGGRDRSGADITAEISATFRDSKERVVAATASGSVW